MSSSLPEPLRVRRPVDADAEEVAELTAAYGEAHGAPADVTAADVREQWERVDLAQDAWLVEERGRLVGSADVSGAGELLHGDGYAHPDARGRGIGSHLLELVERRARERGALRLHTATLHRDEAARTLFEARGYRFVRAFLRMAIEP